MMQFLSHVFAIGSAQGMVLAMALLRKRINVRSNRVLALWMVLLALDLSMRVIHYHNPQTPLLPLYVLIQFFPFLHGSFFYLYVRTLTQDLPFKWTDLIHLAGFIYMAGVNITWIINPWENGPGFFGLFELTLYVYSISYVVAGLVTIKRYRHILEEQCSNTDGITLLWVDVMAYFQVLIWFIAVTQWLVPIQGYNVGIIYLAVACWISVMGYLALAQQKVAGVEPIRSPQSPNRITEDQRFPEVIDKLEELMHEQQLFLEPSLTIGQLAQKSGYPVYLVSLAINHTYQLSFREYINQLRIDVALDMLRQPGEKRNILDVAYASGFTSKSTFNSAFKKLQNMTPSEFRSKQEIYGAVVGPNAGDK